MERVKIHGSRRIATPRTANPSRVVAACAAPRCSSVTLVASPPPPGSSRPRSRVFHARRPRTHSAPAPDAVPSPHDRLARPPRAPRALRPRPGARRGRTRRSAATGPPRTWSPTCWCGSAARSARRDHGPAAGRAHRPGDGHGWRDSDFAGAGRDGCASPGLTPYALPGVDRLAQHAGVLRPPRGPAPGPAGLGAAGADRRRPVDAVEARAGVAGKGLVRGRVRVVTGAATRQRPTPAPGRRGRRARAAERARARRARPPRDRRRWRSTGATAATASCAVADLASRRPRRAAASCTASAADLPERPRLASSGPGGRPRPAPP